MRSFFRNEPGLAKIFALLVALASVILAYDVWEVATGHTDLNQHLPFFLPAVLSAFAGIVWFIRKRYLSLPPEDQKRVQDGLYKGSYLHPDNLPKGRSRPGSLG